MALEIKKTFSAETGVMPENNPEHASLPENRPEQAVGTQEPRPAAVLPRQNTPVQAPVVDRFQKEVEEVLSENIADIYKQLPQDKKMIFKQRGEEIAVKISAMIKSGMIQIKKILKMIREWLHIIPGVNKFFLEQEAKIKTDKIQQLYEREHAVAL